jgi:hypothetical protein
MVCLTVALACQVQNDTNACEQCGGGVAYSLRFIPEKLFVDSFVYCVVLLHCISVVYLHLCTLV